MKWLEIIHIRSIKKNPAKLAKEIKSSMARHSSGGGHFHIQVFFHHTLTKDISVHLHQETVDNRRPTEDLGQALVAGLSEFGYINHNVWIEFESEKSEGT
ncbi:MAG: hypothetical protein HOC09_17890 [Deltaproteobacteria bacterium]|nr:hypothetical protein [Deltaproteobacteria bacterium]